MNVNLKTVAEVAELKDVSRMGVYYWIDNGLKCTHDKPKGRKKRILIDLTDLEEYLRDKEV